MTANSFGVAVPTATVTIRTVCYAISEHLLPKYIHTVQLTSTFKSKDSHIYVELYYLAETRLVCHCLGILLILFYLM